MSTGIFPLPAPAALRDNARVKSEREYLADRIDERREQLGLSRRQVSMQATGKPDIIRDMLRRNSTPSGPALARIAEVLETTTDWLLGRAESAAQPKSEVDFPPSDLTWRGDRQDRIPVFGTGYCDDLEVQVDSHVVHVEMTVFEPTNVVALISRPPALHGAKDAYAIYFHGSSMEDRFFQGEIGIAVTNPPPGPGDFVVAQINDGNGDDIAHVLVKRLCRITSTYVEFEQLNPRLTFRLDRRRVTRMHRIVMSGDPAMFR